MTVMTQVDALGRLVIPKSIRRKLRVENGGPVQMEFIAGHLQIKPVDNETARTRKIGGFLVLQDIEPFSAVEAIRKAREER